VAVNLNMQEEKSREFPDWPSSDPNCKAVNKNIHELLTYFGSLAGRPVSEPSTTPQVAPRLSPTARARSQPLGAHGITKTVPWHPGFWTTIKPYLLQLLEDSAIQSFATAKREKQKRAYLKCQIKPQLIVGALGRDKCDVMKAIVAWANLAKQEAANDIRELCKGTPRETALLDADEKKAEKAALKAVQQGVNFAFGYMQHHNMTGPQLVEDLDKYICPQDEFNTLIRSDVDA